MVCVKGAVAVVVVVDEFVVVEEVVAIFRMNFYHSLPCAVSSALRRHTNGTPKIQ